jgi:elongation factor G
MCGDHYKLWVHLFQLIQLLNLIDGPNWIHILNEERFPNPLPDFAHLKRSISYVKHPSFRFLRALSVIVQEDPAIRIETAPDDVPTILSGMSEEHLEAICDRLLGEFKLQLDIGEPTVIYLETVRKSAEAEGKYIRQTGGAGNYGHVKIRVEPNEAGKGFEFVNDIKGGVVPRDYIKPTEQGIREALQGGVLAGYEIVDVKATLFDSSFHEVDSNEMAFKIAGSMAFKEAARKATPVLLEPVMSVEVVVPEEYIGATIGDLNGRRGRIEGMEQRAGSQVIKASVPLAEMLGYGRGRFYRSVQFARYEAAPRRDWLGGDGAGVTANKPVGPKAGSGFAANSLYAEPE